MNTGAERHRFGETMKIKTQEIKFFRKEAKKEVLATDFTDYTE